MRIDRDIAARHWQLAAEEQLMRTYESQGYKVKRHSKIGRFQVDLIARKGSEVIVVEIKSSVTTETRSSSISSLRKYVVQKLGGQFHLVYITPPRDLEIQVDNLDELLLEILVDDPRELADIATYVEIESVEDVEIDAIRIPKGEIRIKGSGSVVVELRYGSSADFARGDGVTSGDLFPFYFEIAVSDQLDILRVDRLDIDTSSFYE